LFPGGLNVQTRLAGGTSIVQGLFIEVFLTANLVLVVIMLAVVKQKSTFLAPVCIGLVLFMCQMIGQYFNSVPIPIKSSFADYGTARDILHRLLR
jgi:aquaporin related protein